MTLRHGRTTVVQVTLRRAIRDLLTGGGDATGLGDVPADEVAQALTSYADTASLAEADALAPIVTRASHVPFDEDVDGDLGAPLLDVHADLAALDPVDVDPDGGIDPGQGIDDPASGNDRTSDEPDRDADTDDVDDVDDVDDDAHASDIDPDDWFDSAPAPPDGSSDLGVTEAAPAADDAIAFGTGTATAGLDADPLDDIDSALDPTLEQAPVFGGAAFESPSVEADAINEVPIADGEYGSEYGDDGELGPDTVADDGSVDDAFGDVDFDM